MKTAISMPDEVFEQTTRRAKKLGISRSELITRALRHYLAEESAAAVQASYDAAFGPDSGDDSGSHFRRRAARTALAKVEW